MRVPDEILKCVVFLGVTETSNKPGEPSRDRYAGTAFVVGVAGERLPQGHFTYLVSAAHVVDRIEGDCWLRVNLTKGGVEQIDIGERRWVRHPEGKSVDVAVLPWDMGTEIDHMLVPTRMMLVSSDMFRTRNIGVGDEVFMTGVFASAYGRERNSPILRNGNIAMLPEDKIPTKDLGEVDAYLIETHSFGGISGSPVFVQETVALKVNRGEDPPDTPPNTIAGTGSHFLLGLVHGHWEIDERDINAVHVRGARQGEESINLGISIVIPASKIVETLNQPALVEVRRRAEQRMIEQESLR